MGESGSDVIVAGLSPVKGIIKQSKLSSVPYLRYLCGIRIAGPSTSVLARDGLLRLRPPRALIAIRLRLHPRFRGVDLTTFGLGYPTNSSRKRR